MTFEAWNEAVGRFIDIRTLTDQQLLAWTLAFERTGTAVIHAEHWHGLTREDGSSYSEEPNPNYVALCRERAARDTFEECWGDR